MAEPNQFPIMVSKRWGDGRPLVGPRSIPWSVIAPFEDQAKRNHSQTLRRLAERGGLDPFEALAVLTGRTWREAWPSGPGDEQDALDDLARIVASHQEPTDG